MHLQINIKQEITGNLDKIQSYLLHLVAFAVAFLPLWEGWDGAVFAQECNIVYVTSGGATAGVAGTKNNPADLLYGLSLANAVNNKIHMASGTYIVYNPVNMKSDITLEGGFNALTWIKSNATATTIYRDNSNLENSPKRLVAMYGINIFNFRLQDLTLRCANAFGSGISSYGLYLSNCSNYNIVRCKIFSGNAGNGDNGTNGASGIGGAQGASGENGDEQGPCCTLGGAGASGSFPGSYGGGTGGNGGDRGTASCSFCGDPQDATNGYPGTSGLGPGGGVGGNGGAKIVVCIYPVSCMRTPLNDGQAGVAGTDGLPGTVGVNGMGSFIGGFFVPVDGTPGTGATHGSGGGGGGGGGSLGGIPYDCLFGLPPNWNGSGAGGGGGSEGGQGALGGLGGTGAGGSFAVYLNNNGANGVIKDCQLTPGNRGLGGLGGLGGTGGLGGIGGLRGGTANCSIGAGGNGGDGGKGGDGGAGGIGSDGLKYALYEDPVGAPVSFMNINSLQQPFVSVKYTGCTDAPVEFSTNASGTIQWYFGAGSVPSTLTGNPSVPSYSTTGRKTFTLVNNGIPYTYSDFIEIYSNGAGLNPSIAPFTSDTLCIGDMGSFGSTVTAANYIWVIQHDTLSDTLSGPGFPTIAYTFDSVGVYTVILKTFNSCCGESFPDTVNVTILPITTPSISINSSDTTNLVCNGANLTFSASAANVSFPFFQWYVNGLPVGTNSAVFSSSALADGDSINCMVMTTAGCSTGLSDTSNSITVTVVGLPAISCDAASFISGKPTYFNAWVTSGGLSPFTYTWDFGDQTMGMGDTVAHIYATPGVYDVQVNVIDSNGCAGSCNSVVSVFSELSAEFTAYPFNGCAPLTIDFINQSIDAVTYLWEFGDGATSILENPSYTYYNPGTYTVTLNAYGATGTDSSVSANQVLVLPVPVANFQGYPQVISNPVDTVFFADNSVSAWSWNWSFGDPASGSNNYSTLQNPWHFYSALGAYTVTLIVTNEYGCSDSLTKPGFILVGIDTSGGGVGIAETKATISFMIYPNPMGRELFIDVESSAGGAIDVKLLNLQGQTLAIINNTPLKIGKTLMFFDLSTVSLSEGLYFLNLTVNEKNIYRKIIHAE